jgi:capsular polysaccharide biosynthesis protein
MLRTRLASKLPPPQSRNDLIYLRRGKTGAARIVENEDEIERALLKQGFTIIDIASAHLQRHDNASATRSAG